MEALQSSNQVSVVVQLVIQSGIQVGINSIIPLQPGVFSPFDSRFAVHNFKQARYNAGRHAAGAKECQPWRRHR